MAKPNLRANRRRGPAPPGGPKRRKDHTDQTLGLVKHEFRFRDLLLTEKPKRPSLRQFLAPQREHVKQEMPARREPRRRHDWEDKLHDDRRIT